jgi:hypothetical protein
VAQGGLDDFERYNEGYPLYDVHGNMVATLTKNTGEPHGRLVMSGATMFGAECVMVKPPAGRKGGIAQTLVMCRMMSQV